MKALKILLTIILITLISACSVKLTQEGGKVREIVGDRKFDCEFLGHIETSFALGWTSSDNRRTAKNKLYNQVAEIGGNAVFIKDISSSAAAATNISSEAYKCPF